MIFGKSVIRQSQLALSALLLIATPLMASADEDAQLSADLRLEAFPALQATEDSLRLLDVNHEHNLLSAGFSPASGSKGLDLSTSYVWESPRFGHFVVSTNTSYVYNTVGVDGVRESSAMLSRPEASVSGIGLMPERQSSLTLSWQIGNHTATAVTSYSEAIDRLGLAGLDKLNVDDLNELVGQITTLDLRYGYNVRSNASISVGVRNMFERRMPSAGFTATGATQPAGSVAYGTIKYQF